jgi:tRNA nucleotidyltransferase (CCA-adding enzyme)
MILKNVENLGMGAFPIEPKKRNASIRKIPCPGSRPRMPLFPIYLNRAEQEIFSLLRLFVRSTNLGVTMRVAGGWVRDKLLGLECHDLDIALDTMTGQSFATRLKDFLHACNHNLVSAFGVIPKNPEQSKHLETATLSIMGTQIDFVNLRSENYSLDSRIPVIDIGTPLEDALRRDLTINSLFYNLETDKVEDFTGHGVRDIEDGIIRTPLCPLITLTDDPLRLLRAIRFSARFKYQMVPELETAMLNTRVSESFLNKVSRERVGIEIDKICTNENRNLGLKMISKIPTVYPLIVGKLPVDISKNVTTFELIVNRVLENNYILSRQGALSLFCLPFAGEIYTVKKGAKIREEKVTMLIAKESLKLSNKDAALVLCLVEYVYDVINLDPSDPKAIGRLLKLIGADWREAFLLAHLLDDRVRHKELEKKVESISLADSWKWKPLLSGDEIRELFPSIDPQEIGRMITQILDWQYSHPTGTKPELQQFITLNYTWPSTSNKPNL